MADVQRAESVWPELARPGDQESCRTLHLWSQIVGKTRLALSPMMNHWWQVPLYVTARGLSTSLMPHGDSGFEVEFDLLASRLEVRSASGDSGGFDLVGHTVASFHRRYFETLERLGITVTIHPLAVEIAETIHLDRDHEHRRYDPDWARRFFVALLQTQRVLSGFRARFAGKASAVHFFWGSFDLAVTRFSGRRAPRHPGGAAHCADSVMHEAYSHEVSSAGLWLGGPGQPTALFYAYAYPEPPGFAHAPVLPPAARYDATLREFVLPYDAVRASAAPEADLGLFLESTYVAAAELARWPRRELERSAPEPEEDRDEVRL